MRLIHDGRLRRRLALGLLLVLGTGRMILDLVGASAPAALLGATGAAPAPKVFSSVDGLETYSSRFFVQWTDGEGHVHEEELTPDRTARLEGPYNRRNVYGAALAYGPILQKDPRTAPLLAGVSSHAFCGEAPLLAELGIETPGRVGPVRIRLAPIAVPHDAEWSSLLEVHCS
ncbi:MAG: hypothetical protein QNK05_17905 [Myxococcota bacterium]|nr:hypothetical protein [Myxococcota bacterium]